MTQTKLDALPESGGYDWEETIEDGRKVRRPVVRPCRVLHHGDSSGSFITYDTSGDPWMIGEAGGSTYKQRM